MLNLCKIFRKSQGFTIPNFISKIEDKKYEVFMHARLLEVLYVKSKKKTQVPNCPGAEMSHTGAEFSGCRNVLVPYCPGAEVSSIS